MAVDVTEDDWVPRNFPDINGFFSLNAHKSDLKKGFKGNPNLKLWRHDENGLLQMFGRNDEDVSQFHSSPFYYTNDDSRKDEFVEVKVKCVDSSFNMKTVAVINGDEVQKIFSGRGRKWIFIKPLMYPQGQLNDI